MSKSIRGFTIVELLIVIVVIAILASISIVAYNGAQGRARDIARISKIKDIADALELYFADQGSYPNIQDGNGAESSCGSQTENWGHCDRLKVLTDALAPYIALDPTSLSSATQGSYYYYYDSPSANGYQTYGLRVTLEGNAGANDGGYYANAYEVGPDPAYCFSKYTGANGNWIYNSTLNQRCVGGV